MEADAFVRRGGPAARVRAGAAPRPPALWLSLSRARAKRTFSPKKKPRTAIIDNRPCMSSASRRSFTEEMVLQFFESPSGSKKPSGAEMPASPCMNSLGVGGGGGGGGGGSSGAASPAAALPATRPLLAGAQPHRGVRGALPAALPPETLIFITAILPLPRLGRARDPHNHHHHCRVTKSTLCGHDRFALLRGTQLSSAGDGVQGVARNGAPLRRGSCGHHDEAVEPVNGPNRPHTSLHTELKPVD